ncbi:MAG: flagellar protein FlaG [candidate division Zixibacteria bacterium]|nr:flagellar protein FlaG [candidate division Zixibacteria bacterium]
MNGEITTQMALERVGKSADQPLGGVSPKTPVHRDKIKTQVSENTQSLEKDKSVKLSDDPKKVKELVQEAISDFDKFVKSFQVDLKYEIDDKTDELIIKIFEKGTDKLIRQIPPEEFLRLKERINDLLGIIYDETV